MIPVHHALLLRGHRGSLGQPPLWLIIGKSIGLLVLLYAFIVCFPMSKHFQAKAGELSSQWRVVLWKDSSPQNDCELGRLDSASEMAWDDALSFNPARMLSHWNTDYLAKQPRCGPSQGRK